MAGSGKSEHRSLPELLRLGPYARDGRETLATMEEAAAVIEKCRDQWECRADRTLVRKDRWEWGVRRIVALLEGNRREFEIDEVVEAVRALKYARSEEGPVMDVLMDLPERRPPSGAANDSSAQDFDLAQHLWRQMEFSARTYGPGERTDGICDHLRKELNEVRAASAAGVPTLPEWVDVIILGFDGAWRSGATPDQIVAAIVAKQTKNEGRKWPDWRTADRGKAIEHDRSDELPGMDDMNEGR